MNILAATCIAVLLAMSPTDTAESTYEPYVVEDSPGGLIGYFNTEFQTMEASHRPVVIKGKCMSACTRYMKLSKVCALPGAVFGFHAARNADTQELMIEMGRKDMEQHLLPSAYALVIRYGAYKFGFETDYRGPKYQSIAPGISIYHGHSELFGLPVNQKFLMVAASKLIRQCPMKSL